MRVVAGDAILANLIGDAWQQSVSPRSEPILNPATGDVLAHVPFSTREEVDQTVAAALAAWPAWRETPVPVRARYMFAFRELLERYANDLARKVTLENGKTLEEARGEVRRGIEVVEFAAGMPTLMMGAVLQNVANGIDCELIRQPVGVVAGICPFNFPVMIPLWMIPLAIACGNTFVLKPSERTPLSAQLLAELLMGTGLPAGVFNVVNGAKEVVDRILMHPEVRAVSFVGSAPVAKYVYATAAAHGKRVQALGGAKNHLIVMPDADLDRAIPAIVSSAFGNAGERCLATSVVIAVGSVADRLMERLAAATSNMRVGPGTDSATDMGPLIREGHLTRVEEYVTKGVQEGATLICKGRRLINGGGFYLTPTIFDHVEPWMAIAREEVFGPVLSVIRVGTLEEAISVINRSPYGNATAIFTESGAAARAFHHAVEAGMVGVNVGVPAPLAFFPFAGWKGSFYGDLHATGRDAINFYTDVKLITSRWE